MKCNKCNRELTNDTKFCSYCGAKVEITTEIPPIPPEAEYAKEAEYAEEVQYAEVEIVNNKYENNTAYDISLSSGPTNKAGKTKNKIVELWNNLSIIEKISAGCVALFVVLGLVAFIAGRVFSGIAAVVAILLIATAVLMNKKIIKMPKSWIPILAICLSFALLIPYSILFSLNTADFVKYDWNEVTLAHILAKPQSPYGKVNFNSLDSLSLNINQVSRERYNNYVSACRNTGFQIDAEQFSGSFNAFNKAGYELSLIYDEKNREMQINVNAKMKLGTLVWPENEMSKYVPIPKSAVGNIEKNDGKTFAVSVGETTIDAYNAYIVACMKNGFNVDAVKSNKHYYAKNNDSYKLTVEYQGNNIIYISIDEPEFNVAVEVECDKNWIFSQYNIDVYVDDSHAGTLVHGTTDTYPVILTKGVHVVKFVSTEDKSVNGKAEVIISKDETLKFKIACSSLVGISVDTISGTPVTDEAQKSSNS